MSARPRSQRAASPRPASSRGAAATPASETRLRTAKPAAPQGEARGLRPATAPAVRPSVPLATAAPDVDPLPAMLTELDALTRRYNDACERLVGGSDIGVTIMALEVVRKAGLAAIEGKGTAALEAIADPLPAAGAAPRLTSTHLQLIASTSDALDTLGEARETVMGMIADGTHRAADDKTRGRVAWLHSLLLTLWGLDGHLCTIAGELTGVAGSEPATRHAHQMAQLEAFSRQVSEGYQRCVLEQAAQAIAADD